MDFTAGEKKKKNDTDDNELSREFLKSTKKSDINGSRENRAPLCLIGDGGGGFRAEKRMMLLHAPESFSSRVIQRLETTSCIRRRAARVFATFLHFDTNNGDYNKTRIL